ncbi:phage tail protein [Archangium violaceum]|uniref:Phage tail protein n=1 Tax=Archangium violaceum Cb vi76 TaxID=1406225 RepID=A0A084T296_9BACT|nr:phage tail protein [Archangium violaceum]KFA94831.1 phage tail protein [Archangium violaceum Cb vi76]
MAMERKDPFGSYNFAVELDGITRMGFKECSGLESSTNSSKYREGTDPTLGHREIPSLLSFSTITLKRGITDDRALWDWREGVSKGAPVRRTLSIILRDDTGAEKIRWNVRNAWPSKWSGPSFDATTDELGIETLELTHEGIEVQKW